MTLTAEDVATWFAGQLPDGGGYEVSATVDRDEILVTVQLADPDFGDEDPPEDAGQRELAERQHIVVFREDSRDDRVAVALRAEALFERKVSWQACCGETTAPFTTLSVPVMTRLRLEERRILDTLVGAGVARSRSEAVAWCVREVAEHRGEWFTELADAIAAVESIRNQTP